MQYGVHVIQLDKLSLDDIYKIVTYKNQYFEHVKILVAGGVNRSNVQEYAKTNIGGVVTSSVYLSGMADLGSRLQLIEQG
jgi:molybdenum transport protein